MKRFLSFLLAILMLTALLPLGVWAEEEPEEAPVAAVEEITEKKAEKIPAPADEPAPESEPEKEPEQRSEPAENEAPAFEPAKFHHSPNRTFIQTSISPGSLLFQRQYGTALRVFSSQVKRGAP